MLGYDQVSWDNESGRERQPESSFRRWSELTYVEKAAAKVLGYRQKVWDDESGNVPQPASEDRTWAGLTTCTDGKDMPSHQDRVDIL